MVVIDADQLVRDLYQMGEPGWIAVTHHWGQWITDEDGQINRKKLGSIIFSNDLQRKKLDGLIHPLIQKEFIFRVGQHAINGVSLIVYDMPLLFEVEADSHMECVICIHTSDDVQLNRLMKRNNLTEIEAKRRIRAQMPLSEKVSRANYQICNNGTMSETENQLEVIWKKITRE